MRLHMIVNYNVSHLNSNCMLATNNVNDLVSNPSHVKKQTLEKQTVVT